MSIHTTHITHLYLPPTLLPIFTHSTYIQLNQSSSMSTHSTHITHLHLPPTLVPIFTHPTHIQLNQSPAISTYTIFNLHPFHTYHPSLAIPPISTHTSYLHPPSDISTHPLIPSRSLSTHSTHHLHQPPPKVPISTHPIHIKLRGL